MKTISVEKLIKQLQEFPNEALVRFSVTQYNKTARYGTDLQLGGALFASDLGQICDMMDGMTVKINLALPETETYYTILSKRAK